MQSGINEQIPENSGKNRVSKARLENEWIIKELSSLPQGTKIYTELKTVSRSGMSRQIKMFFIKNGSPIVIYIKDKDFFGINPENRAYKVSGCGMDMGFHLVYSLGHYVRQGLKEEFEDHGQKTKDNGYWFRQEWI